MKPLEERRIWPATEVEDAANPRMEAIMMRQMYHSRYTKCDCCVIEGELFARMADTPGQGLVHNNAIGPLAAYHLRANSERSATTSESLESIGRV